MERMKEQIRSKLYTTNEYGFEHQVPDVQLSQEEIEWLVKNYKIRTSLDNGIPIHRTCINCQTRQLMKYENFKDPAGKTSNSFSVKCDFIPGALPPGSKDLLKKYQEESNVDSERALLYLKSTIDPVAWLSLMFGFSDDNSDWRIRDYQKEQQRCTSKRLVLRIGRRGGKTLSVAMKLLYQLFNYEVPRGSDLNGNKVIAGPEIVVITPYQAQIAGVFDAMEMLLKRNKALSSCVITGTSGALYIKTPYYRLQVQDILNEDGDIVKAGGIISGFVSGIGVKDDGSGGGTIRGTDADIIYLDEMDMIPVQTLDRVIKPLLLTRPGVILYASSTPIGKRDKFY
ncbi:MAG: DEAD/DEAH box helicase family protein, partial [Candidatus Aenigmarchaeota archaeon]|nr:DEAD/DEAH box helicase family protein [Candidatus Aenigmarchaeota archaeon]